jgi:hypothetical protein
MRFYYLGNFFVSTGLRKEKFPKAIKPSPSLKIFDSFIRPGTVNGQKEWTLMVGKK